MANHDSDASAILPRHAQEALGARRVARVHHWWVMEAPTGHRFCVIQAKPGALDGKAGVTVWE